MNWDFLFKPLSFRSLSEAKVHQPMHSAHKKNSETTHIIASELN